MTQKSLEQADRHDFTVSLDGAELRVAQWGAGPAEIVMLHDGLGSIDQWRSIPGQVAATAGRTVLAYDRPGHGDSTPVPGGPWPADWLHQEADRLARFLAAVDVDRPLLVGHSDGGSIALIHGASTGGRDLAGILTLAAHTWVEQRCYQAIAEMRTAPDRFVAGLARAHANPAAIFEAWSGVWVSDEFGRWDIRPQLSSLACPTVVAQGRLDEYATEAHVTETVAAIGASARPLLLDGVGHLLHHQDPALVVDVIIDVVESELEASNRRDRP